MERTEEQASAPKPVAKKAYRKPVIQVYGNLAEITASTSIHTHTHFDHAPSPSESNRT